MCDWCDYRSELYSGMGEMEDTIQEHFPETK